MTIELRRLGPSDIDLARRAVAEVHVHDKIDDAALAAFLGDSACVFVVAVEGDRVVGSVYGYALRRPGRDERNALLYELDVVEDCRRRGVGARLVDAFVTASRDAGAAEVWVLTNDANVAAMATYRRCGFVRVNRDDAMLRRST